MSNFINANPSEKQVKRYRSCMVFFLFFFLSLKHLTTKIQTFRIPPVILQYTLNSRSLKNHTKRHYKSNKTAMVMKKTKNKQIAHPV